MADRPRRREPLSHAAQIAGWGAAALVIGFVTLWALPVLLTRHPSSGLTAAERLSAVNSVRSVLVTFLLAVGAGGSLFFTARTFWLGREAHVTERYTQAVGQIGDGSLEVRIGGIYALERIGRDSASDRPTVVYVLSALVRSRSRDDRGSDAEPSEDVYAALRVISRLAPATNVVVYLGGADLHNANLRFMKGVQVRIDGADLTGAKVPDAWNALLQPADRDAEPDPSGGAPPVPGPVPP